MPSLATYSTTRPIKALYLGDAGSGKTGSLTSLVQAGYKLRIWDFDNLLEPLFQYVKKECPDKASNVTYQTFTDKIKAPAQLTAMIGNSLRVMPVSDGTPTAFPRALKQFDHWKTPEEDLGCAREWDMSTIVVIDTLSSLARAAFRYVQAMNPGAKESQTYYFAAQQLIVNVLADLFSEQFKPNVFVLAHLDYDKNHLEIQKGYPRSMGRALQTEIGSYFNCVLMAESANNRRVIRTKSTGVVDLKNPISFAIEDPLPLETGLATFMEKVRAK